MNIDAIVQAVRDGQVLRWVPNCISGLDGYPNGCRMFLGGRQLTTKEEIAAHASKLFMKQDDEYGITLLILKEAQS